MSAFVDGERERFGVEPICMTLGVSASAYYERASVARSPRAVADERLLERIRELHAANYCAYGYRRMWKALKRAGERVPRCRVQRLMRANGIVGAKRRGKPWRTTKANPQALRRPDLVQRDFTASLPNNNARLHESLGDIPPVEYEQRHTKRRAVAASLRSPYGLAPRDGDAEHEGATTLTIESTRPN